MRTWRGREDQVSQMMRNAFGVESPAAREGRCHYCGLPLNRRGTCDECV